MNGFLFWDRSEAEHSEYDEQGWLNVQVNGYGGGGLPASMAHAPSGFLGRPLDPDDDGACKTLVINDGNEKHALATVDLRVLKKLPQLKKGGSVQFGSDGGFEEFNPETHTWTLYIPTDFDGVTPTKAHLVQVGKDPNAKRVITLLHADGQGLSMLEGGKRSAVLKNAESTAYVEVNDDGLVFNGLSMFRGGVAEMVGPLDAAIPTPLARATQLLAWATQLVATLNAAITKVNTLPGPPVPPMVPLPPNVASGT